MLERGGPSTGETGGKDIPPWANGTTVSLLVTPFVQLEVQHSVIISSPGLIFLGCSTQNLLTKILISGAKVGGAQSLRPKCLLYIASAADITVHAGCLLGGGASINGG